MEEVGNRLNAMLQVGETSSWKETPSHKAGELSSSSEPTAPNGANETDEQSNLPSPPLEPPSAPTDKPTDEKSSSMLST